MSGWVKTHESWTERDDVEQLGSDAAMLHLSSLAYCARHLRDGVIPWRALRKLWPVDDLETSVKTLVEADFWEERDEGYFIRDWRDHILGADEVAHRREQDRLRQERKRRHDAGDHSRCDRCRFVRHGVTPDVSHDVSHGAVTRPEPNRTEPNRPEGEVRGGGRAEAGSANASTASGPTHEYLPGDECCPLPEHHPVHAARAGGGTT